MACTLPGALLYLTEALYQLILLLISIVDSRLKLILILILKSLYTHSRRQLETPSTIQNSPCCWLLLLLFQILDNTHITCLLCHHLGVYQ